MGRGRSIFARTILLQVELSRAFGLPEASLRALGLEAERLSDPDARVDEETVYAHLEAVAAHLPEGLPRFIVALAEQHETTTLGLPGFAMRTAPTLRDGVGVMHRYQHLTSSLAAFELVELGALARWSEHRDGEERLGSLLATEISLLITLHLAREVLGERIIPIAIEIRRAIEPPPEYLALAGCPFIHAPRGAMTFPVALLDRPVATANADMSAYFLRELERLAQSAAQAPALLVDLRRALTAQLLSGVPSLESGGKALGLSARTLQRKLAAEGTTFGEVLEALRRDLATSYLSSPRYSAAEVAFLLGYSEASSFYRAFKRWTGLTPEEHRHRSRAPRSASEA